MDETCWVESYRLSQQFGDVCVQSSRNRETGRIEKIVEKRLLFSRLLGVH
jgi:hypothetical protein